MDKKYLKKIITYTNNENINKNYTIKNVSE